MTIDKREQAYQHLKISSVDRALRLKKSLSVNSLLRLMVFLSGAAAVYLLYGKTVFLTIAVLCTGILFFILLRRHGKLSEQKNREEATQKIAEDELRAFRYDFTPFDGMEDRVNPAHDFSFDLDIFGKGSVAQIINRASLKTGKKRLADMLENPLDNKEAIIARQRAVSELAGNEDFCLDFRVTGSLSGDVLTDVDETKSMFAGKGVFRNPSVWKLLTVIIPVIYAGYFLLSVIHRVPGSWFWALYTFTLAISVIPMKKISRLWITFDKKSITVSSYSRLFRQVENTRFQSSLLQNLQGKIMGEKPASQRIQQLAGYIQNLNSAFAFPVFLILNPFLLWNVLYALKIEKWLSVNGAKTNEWFSALAEFDALISLGTFAVNHPDYTFPKISETFRFSGKSLGHPLIPRAKCVKNDVDISRKPYFMVVTGANMAGKSTYLRTVGVNHLLASIGAPVCADELTFFPGRLLTNLRTSDSLVNNESYFFAELKRLKMIIDRLQSGENGLFVILDEILKGTNSEDKRKGSFALMKRLVKLGGNGIIATHDLALGDLENEFPEAVKNFHFDAVISGETLTFTYKLEAGIAQNMNASFLMKTMGIV